MGCLGRCWSKVLRLLRVDASLWLTQLHALRQQLPHIHAPDGLVGVLYEIHRGKSRHGRRRPSPEPQVCVPPLWARRTRPTQATLTAGRKESPGAQVLQCCGHKRGNLRSVSC